MEVSTNFNFDYFVPKYDRNYVHMFETEENHKGLILLPKNQKITDTEFHTHEFTSKKVINIEATLPAKFDIFFISFDEENSREHWYALNQRFPRAKHIYGIKGIHNAHKKCASLSETDMFYTVDADTVINEDWDFNFVPPPYDQKYLHVWYSKNPINNLEYGYGAVKLWPKEKVLSFDNPWIDFTTSVGNLKVMDKVISTTEFNSSPWKIGRAHV